jgi:hypothetical protein
MAGRRRIPAIALPLGLVVLPATLGLAGEATVGPRSAAAFCDMPSGCVRTVRCAEAAFGEGKPSRPWAKAGPVFMSLGGGAHWNPVKRRFSAKVPLVVRGSGAVTVQVPKRLLGRFSIFYGAGDPAPALRFEPCAYFRFTFFPGGIVFERREALSLLVSVEGSEHPKVLHLGRASVRR